MKGFVSSFSVQYMVLSKIFHMFTSTCLKASLVCRKKEIITLKSNMVAMATFFLEFIHQLLPWLPLAGKLRFEEQNQEKLAKKKRGSSQSVHLSILATQQYWSQVQLWPFGQGHREDISWNWIYILITVVICMISHLQSLWWPMWPWKLGEGHISAILSKVIYI